MPGAVSTVFGLMGGLAMFLYAMTAMTAALEAAAGESLRRVLAAMTRTPLAAAISGAAVTAVLQSSSAATVTVISFVGAGLMGLPQAVAVIFGANIGTTVTAQLLAFPLGEARYPLLFLGFAVHFLAANDRVKNSGLALFSFGLLLEGIEIMGRAMAPLGESPAFLWMMGHVTHRPGLGMLLGTAMTVIVQSSSAAVAILQRFAAQSGSAMGLGGAVPILLGCNIGTTVTALIAAVGQSKDAKRTALAHCVFNISGSGAILAMLPLFTRLAACLSPASPIARQIANAHTLFNVVCTLLWLPLTPLMVKLVTHLIPEKCAKTRRL